MTYDEGVAHCAASGSTLASIYDASELAEARAAISAAGVEKAITSASSDGSGWAWHGTERWEEGGFPLNTGQVTDTREGAAGHIYSLHRSQSNFVWDADGRGERHPVLCRGGCGTMWEQYVLAPSGTHDCSGCGQIIDSYEACAGAAEAGAAGLGIAGLGGSKIWDGPPGCHIQDGKNFQWNANENGGSAVGHTPVCLVTTSPPPLSPGASEQVVSRPKVTVVLKADMTLDAYNSDQERIKGALRAKLGCGEPLCMLHVTVTPGSVILTVVAIDTSPNSQLVVAATAMVSSDFTTLSTDLGISIVEQPTVQIVLAEVTVVRPAPSPPPPTPSPTPSPPPPTPSPPPPTPSPPPEQKDPLVDSGSNVETGDGEELSGGALVGIIGGIAVFALVLGLVYHHMYNKRRQIPDVTGQLSGIVDASVIPLSSTAEQVQMGNLGSGAGGSNATPVWGAATLATELEMIKSQLNLAGNVKEVLEEAALQLNINFQGRPLRDVSMDCVRVLGGKAPFPGGGKAP